MGGLRDSSSGEDHSLMISGVVTSMREGCRARRRTPGDGRLNAVHGRRLILPPPRFHSTALAAPPAVPSPRSQTRLHRPQASEDVRRVSKPAETLWLQMDVHSRCHYIRSSLWLLTCYGIDHDAAVRERRCRQRKLPTSKAVPSPSAPGVHCYRGSLTHRKRSHHRVSCSTSTMNGYAQRF
jgi:hypothetical protein